jgi:hypothetical protein
VRFAELGTREEHGTRESPRHVRHRTRSRLLALDGFDAFARGGIQDLLIE